MHTLDLKQLIQCDRSKPLLSLITESEGPQFVLLQSRREDELRIRIVFDESWRSESFDRLVVVHFVHATTPLGLTIPILHTASPTTVGLGLATRVLDAEGVSCVENRSVSCAPTQVAVKSLFHLILCWVGVIPQQSIETHDNARRTETALASMRLGYPFLCGMRVLCVANPLNGNDVFSIETYKRCQTGVDTGVVDLFRCWVILAYNNGAGTTPTLTTATVR